MNSINPVSVSTSNTKIVVGWNSHPDSRITHNIYIALSDPSLVEGGAEKSLPERFFSAGGWVETQVESPYVIPTMNGESSYFLVVSESHPELEIYSELISVHRAIRNKNIVSWDQNPDSRYYIYRSEFQSNGFDAAQKRSVPGGLAESPLVDESIHPGVTYQYNLIEMNSSNVLESKLIEITTE
ncbi:hypothetical protein N8198_08035 [Gammaproteobacteria bacterium]|nr:hypothetical protein [Gammaproteobacteria bacterium]